MKSILAFIFVVGFGVGFGVLGAQGAAPLPVECTVLSPNGETVAGAEVKFILRPNYNQEAEKDEILATGSTDAAGVFRMTLPDRALEAIKYGTVLASKTGVGIGGVAAAFVRPDGKQMKLSVKLFPAAECRVRLLRPDGSPAAGVTLRVDQCTMPEDSRGYMYTASYLLPNLPEIGWQGITQIPGSWTTENQTTVVMESLSTYDIWMLHDKVPDSPGLRPGKRIGTGTTLDIIRLPVKTEIPVHVISTRTVFINQTVSVIVNPF